MLRTITLIAIGTCLSTVAGCGVEATSDSVGERDAEQPEAVTPTVTAAQDWEAWVDAENVRIRDERPAFYDQVLRVEPARTRNGFVRFTDPVIHDADAAPILLSRLMASGQDTMVRAALAEALPRTGGEFSVAAAALIEVETDDVVRSVLVGTMRRATPDQALAGLRAGLKDASADVRAEAARTAARRTDGAALATELVAALGDDEIGARTEAARALGALKVTDAVPALAEGLDDGEAAMRLACLRGIARIDPGAARGLDRLDTLAEDPDPRVARVANDLAAKR